MKNIFFIAAAAFALSPATAIAGPNDLAIDYSDLDLSQKDDIRKLEKRVANAAEKHCDAAHPRTGSRIIPSANRQCARQFREAAMEQLAAIAANERKGG